MKSAREMTATNASEDSTLRESAQPMSQPPAVSRRKFILAAAAATAASTLAGQTDSAFAASQHSDQLLNLSARDAVLKMTRGELSSEKYTTALLTQCERAKSLNAFITLDEGKVLQAARAADQRRSSGAKLGPLHGLPIPVKDSVNTKDYPTTGGTNALRHFVPKEDAPIVRALVEAGAMVMGKTNIHELSFGWTSNNLAFGAVHNPYDPSRIPGGSSGGTAAAIAAHMAPIGIAEDTQGSVRVPAALCGIAGFRPSTHRYPTTGVIPITALFDQVGPHARSVSDLLLFDSVVTGEWKSLQPRSLKGVKLGISRKYFFEGLDPEVERITNGALRKLQSAGVQLIEAGVPELAKLIDLTTGPIQSHDALFTLRKYLADYQTGVTFDQLLAQLSPDVKKDFQHDVLPEGPGFITDAVYKTAVEVHLPRLKNIFREYFARTAVEAVVFPATMVSATPIGRADSVVINGKQVPFDVAIARNISPGSTAALPGLVLPAGLTKTGLPVALEFDAPAGANRALLALGLSLESALGPIPAPKI